MCPCPSTIARAEFREAKTCDGKRAALERLKPLVGAESEGEKPGMRSLAFRDLLKKEKAVQDLCTAERTARSAKELEEARQDARQASYNPELDGFSLGRIGPRRRRRRH